VGVPPALCQHNYFHFIYLHLLKLRVGLLAVLGYAYIFLILAVLLAVVALIVLIMIYSHRINGFIVKIGFLALIPALIVLRSLTTKW
jgi:hypothetical protein